MPRSARAAKSYSSHGRYEHVSRIERSRSGESRCCAGPTKSRTLRPGLPGDDPPPFTRRRRRLALVHLLASGLCVLEGTPRSVWPSIAGGVPVAYVFVRLLPELGEAQGTVVEAVGGTFAF